MKFYLWFLLVPTLACAVIPVPSGLRIWQNVALSEELAQTIESQVDHLQNSSNDPDIQGTFTVIDALLDQVIITQSDLDALNLSFVDLQDQVILNESKACLLASVAESIETDLDAFRENDIGGTFTLIEGIQENLLGKYARAQGELEGIEMAIDVLTGENLAHFIATFTTIEALSAELMATVTSLNELAQFTESQTEILSSLLDEIIVQKRTIESKVDVLQDEVTVSFDGTFTLIAAIEQKLCNAASQLESLSLTVTVDLSGTFTAITAVEDKVCSIESIVDGVIQTTEMQEEQLTTVDSKIDQLLSKLDVVDVDVSALDGAVQVVDSLLDQLMTATGDIGSALDLLDSSMEGLVTKACAVDRAVDLLASKQELIESFIDIFDMQLVTIDSQVDLLDSLVDELLPRVCRSLSKAECIASEIEVVDADVLSSIDLVVMQRIDLASSQDRLRESTSKLPIIESQFDLIESKIPALIDQLVTIESRADLVSSGVDTLESLVDMSDTALDSIESNIDVAGSFIELSLDKACTIESKMHPLISKIDMIALTSLCEVLQALAADFQATWTQLAAIDAKIIATDMQVDLFESRLAVLDEVINADLSGTFTALHAVLSKECVVDTKVDLLKSSIDLAAVCGQAELTGTFTVLDRILQKVCTADSQLDIIAQNLDCMQSCLGIPIKQSDVGTAGYDINLQGEYYLAEDINFAPVATGSAAVDINVDNVVLNLNGYTITQTNGVGTTFGVRVATGLSNILIRDGTIRDTSQACLLVDNDCNCVRLEDVTVISGGVQGVRFDPDCNELTLHRVTAIDTTSHGILLDDDGSRIELIDCTTINGTAAGIRLDAADDVVLMRCTVFNASNNGLNITVASGTNLYLEDCYAADCGTSGIQIRFADNGVIKNCYAQNNGADGFRIRQSTNVELVGCSALGNTQSGIRLFDSDQCFVHANRCVDNGQASTINANIRETGIGANSYLNNFALSTGTGPNYSIAGGTTGFSSVLVREGTPLTFATFPRKWTNINMLP